MEQIFQITGICLIGAVLAALLRKNTPELAMLLVLAVAAAVLLSLGRAVEEITEFLNRMMELEGLSPELFRPMLKTTAIALVSRSGAELCRDAGAGTVAHVLETAGALGAILVAIPLFEEVWDTLQMVL